MSFKIPNYPPSTAKPNELADFAELVSLVKGTISAREIIAYLGRIDDNENNEGCNDDEDENNTLVDEAMLEIDRRTRACNGGYPFALEQEGTVIRYAPRQGLCLQEKSTIYCYLLLATRLNMRDNRIHSQIDGTHLLELIVSVILQNYLGPLKSKSLTFGTSIGGNFEARVNSLCQQLNEGSHFRNFNGGSVNANDDKLDNVAWIPFDDNHPGQVIIFAQCKTGTHWESLTSQLRPEVFIQKWINDPFLITPLRAFCISDVINRDEWKRFCLESGIVFDRCRIVENCTPISSSMINSIELWTTAAKDSLNYLTN